MLSDCFVMRILLLLGVLRFFRRLSRVFLFDLLCFRSVVVCFVFRCRFMFLSMFFFWVLGLMLGLGW